MVDRRREGAAGVEAENGRDAHAVHETRFGLPIAAERQTEAGDTLHDDEEDALSPVRSK